MTPKLGKKLFLSTVLSFFAAASVQAQDRWPSSADGFYRAGGAEIQVLNGLPRGGQVLGEALDLIRQGLTLDGLSGSIDVQESGSTTTVRVKFSDAGIEYELKFSVTRSATVSGNSAQVFNQLEASYTVNGETESSNPVEIVETLELNPSNNTILYTGDPNFPEITASSLTLTRVSLGTGTESDPFIPPNANWTRVVLIFVPVFSGRPINADPPLAKGFDYTIGNGRQERFSTIKAPRGFGKKLKVYASAKKSGRMKLVGTVNSGKSLNISKKKGFSKGAARVKIEGLKPRANLSKRAPYPVGLSFTNLKEANAAFKVKAIR